MTEPDLHGRNTAYVVDRFVLEYVAHQLGDPLFVGLRGSWVPAIQTVKLESHGSIRELPRTLVSYLDTADIATTTFEKLVIRVAYFLYVCDHDH